MLFRIFVSVLDFDWFRKQTGVSQELLRSDASLQRGPTHFVILVHV